MPILTNRKVTDMATAFDVAAYILEKHGAMTAMKLQKLVYYSQAWSLVWDEKPLFGERIEAWANGPVVPALYDWHRGAYNLVRCPAGNAEVLTGEERETVDSVLAAYGDKTSQWLSELTHVEEPWKGVRKGLAPGQASRREITHASMAEYYGGLG
jgi:uncharacterized phage-associated protein